ncbi:MAG: hypothetical protein A2445_00570 [Candidatus Jacksonbacteria bacterium RIFOXYC2_FULL_44_29]|nr:MAG: hypothetical protein UW45_C0010G0029 [Parcubacteria group bacterium GW2011_GWC2_44_22]OGY76050.1 MAG: hypothetical protein A2295_03785 [Candidatus Jacksonbacteria bacterium RIFOXYB2_FULL_44_15]OGY76353.1 MAG: hypothetical protein A2240_04300 [Candidatus Jacksonbacteria bacterium RIFOXYA2_FULL_43_12]OGY77991.1 MAG: hypothetical protein A2445_00570 [Candidatus Jacksonbacteria bacterium RIFOXYC2_FULL_44_29]OGY80337.1 MAG: hypothetical protein A2550_04515 [Candidatus Jacksonbacteria bacteri
MPLDTNQAQPTPAPSGHDFAPFRAGQLVSSIDTLKASWQIYKTHWRKLAMLMLLMLGVIALPMGIMMAILFASVFLPNLKNFAGNPAEIMNLLFTSSSTITILIFIVVYLLVTVVSIFFQITLMTTVATLETGKDLKTSFKITWQKFGSLVWVGFIYGLVVMGGYLLFIVPGIIFAIYYGFCMYTCLLEDKRGWAALARSKEIVQGFSWSILRRGILLIVAQFVLILVSMIPVIGWVVNLASPFIMAPLFAIYFFSIYTNLSDLKARGVQKDNLSDVDKLATVGIVLIPMALIILVVGFASFMQSKMNQLKFPPDGQYQGQPGTSQDLDIEDWTSQDIENYQKMMDRLKNQPNYPALN